MVLLCRNLLEFFHMLCLPQLQSEQGNPQETDSACKIDHDIPGRPCPREIEALMPFVKHCGYQCHAQRQSYSSPAQPKSQRILSRLLYLLSGAWQFSVIGERVKPGTKQQNAKQPITSQMSSFA